MTIKRTTIDYTKGEGTLRTSHPFDIEQTTEGWPGAGYAHQTTRVQAVHFNNDKEPPRVILEISVTTHYASGRTRSVYSSLTLTPAQANALAGVCLDPNKGYGK